MLVLLSEETPQEIEAIELRRQAELLIATLVREYIKYKKALLKTEIESDDNASALLLIKKLDDLAKAYPVK